VRHEDNEDESGRGAEGIRAAPTQVLLMVVLVQNSGYT
jgi:hypothetical protein